LAIFGAVSNSHSLEHLDTNLWRIEYPLSMLGVEMKRVVSIIRLESGKLIIHSSAPFSPTDVDSIRELGKPEWLVDVLLRHDTFAEEGRAAFRDASYLAPEGFSADLNFPTGSLLSVPMEWEGQVEVMLVEGAPSFSEIVMLHRESRTLIVGDLLVNFDADQGFIANTLLDLAVVGGKHDPGMTRPFHSAIEDMDAFAESIERILEWDFDRIIVGHGSVISSGGKENLRETMKLAEIPGFE